MTDVHDANVHTLRLYVTGGSACSLRARQNLQQIVDGCDGEYQVEVIDLTVDPLQGLTDHVVVTPTLVQVGQRPVRILMGTLEDHSAVRRALGMRERSSQ